MEAKYHAVVYGTCISQILQVLSPKDTTLMSNRRCHILAQLDLYNHWQYSIVVYYITLEMRYPHTI